MTFWGRVGVRRDRVAAMVRDWVRMRFGSGMGRADVRDGEGRQTSRYISSHTLGIAVSAGASASMHDSALPASAVLD